MGAAKTGASGSDAGFANTTKSKVSFVNYNPPDKPLPKYLPATAKAGITLIKGAAKGLDNITGASKKNKQFMVKNYNRISKNYDLPDKSIFDKMDVKAQNKVYSEMRTDFQRNNLDPFGEKSIGGDGGNNTPTVIKKNIGGSTIQTTAPTEAEVSQSEAANADGAALKVKKRGRSASIMTGPKGVTKTSTNYSLGKPSLLGRV